jgi:hypothetical protein
MTTIHVSGSARAFRMRPLAACLAAACAVSLSLAQPTFAAPTPAAHARTMPFAARATSTPTLHPAAAVTNCDDSGPGSLRDAVGSAVSGDTIDMTALTCGRITLTTGAILIGQDELGFVGPGRDKLAIDAGGSLGSDVFYDLGGGLLYISDLTIEYGSKYRSDHGARGGCIYSNGSITIKHSVVQGCKASAVFPYQAQGGGVFSYGETYLLDTRIVDNVVFNPGNYASGAGVYAMGGFLAKYSQISGNAAEAANSWGGGVFANGQVFVLGSEISGNSANNRAGASFADSAGNEATMINSTVSGNTAMSKVGGLYVRPKLSMYNCTVAFNTETVWNNGAGQYYGAGVNVNVISTIYSSILSNNTVPGVGTPGDIFDLSGNALGVDGGNNVIMEFNIGLPNDTDHGDPGLLPLADNGGRTHTHIPESFNTAGFGSNVLSLQYDQRGPGFPRQTAAGITIGAYEKNPDVIFINGFN